MICWKYSLIISKTTIIHKRCIIIIKTHLQIIHYLVGVLLVHKCNGISYTMYQSSLFSHPFIHGFSVSLCLLHEQILLVVNYNLRCCSPIYYCCKYDYNYRTYSNNRDDISLYSALHLLPLLS